ncbi:anaphase-promoting complex subunit Apc11 [Halteromyces radiatus]|uniref:anaphase-promoting complex subunit Apc11 n=1 Tax=Halteromyces radiatus TaxID=101107 RepID=UPI00221E8C1C|nr:anaphase-promoting complex subunit Apc11 [Halteromyces radiatus]KAI8089208.1 anaphase-promoting complex subunit Apc11 [Halteromyces radiatus]
MKVNIKSWTMAAYWSWDVDQDDVCGICQASFNATCPQCHVPGDDCSVVWGQCKHVFHLHCIEKWLATTPGVTTCPLDRQPWKTVSAPT